MEQSPIAISAQNTAIDRSLGRELNATYADKVNATISNSGHDVVVELPSNAGVLTINGVTYVPAQFHFHTPSEHTICNQSFPVEYHLVHKSQDNQSAVVAFLFNLGAENPILAQFFDKLPSYENPGVKTDLGPIKLLKLGKEWGRYQGSLTTPPCSENVTWTIMLNFPTISTYQVEQLRAVTPLGSNNRATFSSAGRNYRTNC